MTDVREAMLRQQYERSIQRKQSRADRLIQEAQEAQLRAERLTSMAEQIGDEIRGLRAKAERLGTQEDKTPEVEITEVEEGPTQKPEPEPEPGPEEPEGIKGQDALVGSVTAGEDMDRVKLTRWDGEDSTLPGRALTWTQADDGQVAIACENGHMAFLDPRHEIDAEGNINPSLGCPEETCDWHVFGTLEGWTEGERKAAW